MASAPPTGSDAVRSERTVTPLPASTVMTKVVVTAPPWAKDEPPSPTELIQSASFRSTSHRESQSHLSSAAESNASTSNYQHDPAHPENSIDDNPWWTFTRRTRRGSLASGLGEGLGKSRLNWSPLVFKQREQSERPSREGTKSAWLIASPYGKRPELHTSGVPMTPPRHSVKEHGLHMSLPVPGPFTISQSQTPGWESPWSPRMPRAFDDNDDVRVNENMPITREYYRKKKLRNFILNNTYVPLLFRLINIIFTTAALALAISIRNIEQRYDIMGAVGCSPMLVIIFAPPSLVHVMIAVYLDYFGHPLGLWKTSSKLVYALSETLFICAWSSALSLCFDNFFTSIIGCAPASSISWYNQIPRAVPVISNVNLGNREPGETICDRQIVLIALVFVGLIMYCVNLIIGLFRIFEKVKYHTSAILS